MLRNQKSKTKNQAGTLALSERDLFLVITQFSDRIPRRTGTGDLDGRRGIRAREMRDNLNVGFPKPVDQGTVADQADVSPDSNPSENSVNCVHSPIGVSTGPATLQTWMSTPTTS